MQAKHVFAVEAKKYVAVAMASLKDLRNDSNFDEFWSGVKQNAEKLDVDEPILPRKRKAPTRFDPTSSTTHADNTPEDLYRRLYYEVIDTLLGEIEKRFDSDSFELYGKIEKILLSSAKGELDPCDDMIKDVVSHFNDDLEHSDLVKELALVKNVMTAKSAMILCVQKYPSITVFSHKF